MQGIPKELQVLCSEVTMEIPDHIQGVDNIIAYVTGMFFKGKQADVVVQRLGKYTNAYLSFLKTPDIAYGRCGAETE
jgi:hypothetical protein